MATYAALEAVKSAGIDKEELNYIIVAHNFGDIGETTRRVDTVPCLAARVKHKLGIKKPACVSYDLLFGCPGWVQAAIQADYLIKSGDAQKVLVIGTDTLSRVSDPHDRDSMLYAAGQELLFSKRRIVNIQQGSWHIEQDLIHLQIPACYLWINLIILKLKRN